MKSREYLTRMAVILLDENFTLYEASKVFNVDYKNLCAYARGRKQMPMNLVFEILDYCSTSIVVFRRY